MCIVEEEQEADGRREEANEEEVADVSKEVAEIGAEEDKEEQKDEENDRGAEKDEEDKGAGNDEIEQEGCSSSPGATVDTICMVSLRSSTKKFF